MSKRQHWAYTPMDVVVQSRKEADGKITQIEFELLMNSNQARSKGKKKQAQKQKPQRKWVPTAQNGPSVAATLLHHVPLFPISTLRTGQVYFESAVSLTGAAGIQSSYVFSANGAYDPNITGTGHQPMGFDQMMSLYEQYVVVRASIKALFVSNTQAPTRVGIVVAPDTSVPAIVPAVENGLMKMDFVDGKSEAGQHMAKTIEVQLDVAKYFGKTRRELQDFTEAVGTSAANPAEQVYFILTAWGMDTVTYALLVDVVMTFDIFYWEPRKLSVSLAKDVVIVDKSPREETKH
jgi:hypothetical protein